jgi:lysophospholipase L1-like esterase
MPVSTRFRDMLRRIVPPWLSDRPGEEPFDAPAVVGPETDPEPTIWAPPATGLVSYYHADDMATASATPGAQQHWVPRLGDNSGNLHHVQSGANINSPEYDATAFDGEGALHFTASKGAYLQVPTGESANWTFLHDGTGCTVVALVKPTDAAVVGTVVNTTGSSTSRGRWIQHDGINGRFVARVRNASVEILALASANGSAPVGSTHIVAFSYVDGASPEAVLRINGVEVATGDPSASPSLLAPAFGGLALGRLQAAGLNFLNGYIRSVLTYSRALSLPEFEDIEANFRDLQTRRPLRSIWTIGDSITNGTYQQYLWLRHLDTTLCRIDFLGSVLAGEVSLFTDRQHNGHSAHTIQSIQTVTTGIDIGGTPTDIVIIAGTNNVLSDFTATVDAYAALVAAKQAQFPTVPPERFFLASIPRRIDTAPNQAWVATFRDLQQTWIQANGFTWWDADVLNDAQLPDGVHPDAAGRQFLADKLATVMGF